MRISLIVLLLITGSMGGSAAWEGMFEIQNETFFNDDWSIANEKGTPIQNKKSSGGITAWIDITGFRNMSIVNNVSYVNGSPKDFAIVERGATYKLGDGTMTSFESCLTVTDCNITNTTTATQKTILKYEICHTVHTVTESSRDYTVCNSYTKTLSVSCTADSPKTFNNNISDLRITITSYNNSVTPYTLIYIPTKSEIIKTVVEYKNNDTTLYTKIGWVTTNEKGTEHVQFLNRSLQVRDNNNTVTMRAGYYVINEAPLNWELLNIHVYTPYMQKSDVLCNVVVIHGKPLDYINAKSLFVFVSIVLIFLIAGYYVANRGRT